MSPLELTILIVDDWPDSAESLARLLASYGHFVQVAFDGDEALAKAVRYKPDLVLLDIAMPKITGLDVARVLSEQGAKTPLLVAISGNCTDDNRIEAFQAGFDYFFAKPVDTDALLELVNSEEKYLFIAKAD